MHENGNPDEKPLRLSAEQSDVLRKAEIAFENGEKGYTFEEVMQHARAKGMAQRPKQA